MKRIKKMKRMKSMKRVKRMKEEEEDVRRARWTMACVRRGPMASHMHDLPCTFAWQRASSLIK